MTKCENCTRKATWSKKKEQWKPGQWKWLCGYCLSKKDLQKYKWERIKMKNQKCENCGARMPMKTENGIECLHCGNEMTKKEIVSDDLTEENFKEQIAKARGVDKEDIHLFPGAIDIINQILKKDKK